MARLIPCVGRCGVASHIVGSAAAARCGQRPVGSAAAVPAVAAPRVVRWSRGTTPAANFGRRYGQDVEPAGRYCVEDPGTSRAPDREYGTTVFRHPLVLDFGGGYEEPDNWKRVLADRYGETGEALSRALIEDGYDGIITEDRYGTSEIVDLTPLR